MTNQDMPFIQAVTEQNRTMLKAGNRKAEQREILFFIKQ